MAKRHVVGDRAQSRSGFDGNWDQRLNALGVHDVRLAGLTINYRTPDPECDLNYCTEKNIETEVKAGLSNSLGFGGHNATICMKKYV